jgi:molybdopterin adenylyltransferase
MAKVIFVGISETKGVSKKAVEAGVFKENYGLLGDAHADSGWHRQVSLLAEASIAKMRALGLEVGPGDFAENLTCEGIALHSLPVGTRLGVGAKLLLEISQIGKECHTGCAIFKQVGKCIMPKEGVFARVIQGGTVRAGDAVNIVEAKDG